MSAIPKIYLFSGQTDSYEGWFKVWVSEDGFFNAQSDWGNYQHYWGSPGEGGILFALLNFGYDHLLDKLSYGVKHWIDEEATRENVYDFIKNHPTYLKASESEQTQILRNVDMFYDDEDSISEVLYNFLGLDRDECVIYQYDLAIYTKISGQLRQFVAKVMPMVRLAIKCFLNDVPTCFPKEPCAKLTIYEPAIWMSNSDSLKPKEF